MQKEAIDKLADELAQTAVEKQAAGVLDSLTDAQKSILLGSAIGAGVGGIGSMLNPSARRNTLRNTLLGALAGGGGTAIARNFLPNLQKDYTKMIADQQPVGGKPPTGIVGDVQKFLNESHPNINAQAGYAAGIGLPVAAYSAVRDMKWPQRLFNDKALPADFDAFRSRLSSPTGRLPASNFFTPSQEQLQNAAIGLKSEVARPQDYSSGRPAYMGDERPNPGVESAELMNSLRRTLSHILPTIQHDPQQVAGTLQDTLKRLRFPVTGTNFLSQMRDRSSLNPIGNAFRQLWSLPRAGAVAQNELGRQFNSQVMDRLRTYTDYARGLAAGHAPGSPLSPEVLDAAKLNLGQAGSDTSTANGEIIRIRNKYFPEQFAPTRANRLNIVREAGSLGAGANNMYAERPATVRGIAGRAAVHGMGAAALAPLIYEAMGWNTPATEAPAGQ